jgi:hypothetical protein
LHADWTRGEFPRNPDYPDSLVPYFIDARGVACAVGQLVIASGHRGFAQEIARTRNHAYIREIRDPRLAAWAEASGLTLEECARIQPGYGGPTDYSYVRKMEVSRQGTLWTLAGAACLCSGSYFQAFALSPGGNWEMPYSQQPGQATICLDPQGRQLLGFDEKAGAKGLLWNGRLVSGSADAGANDCEWSPDGSMAWVAGNSGLRSYRLSGSELGMTIQPAPRESMLVVAASRAYVWSGSVHGAFGGHLQGTGPLTKLDSAGRTSFRVTGMAGQGTDMLWAGINGNTGNPPTILGSDRDLALTPADSPSVWIATSAGIFKFTPPNTVTRVRSGFSAPVTDLGTDSLGRLYIATWGDGVHRFENGTTRALGYYTVSSAILPDGGEAKAGGTSRSYPGSNSGFGSRSLLGRKIGPSPGMGVFVSKPL